MNFINTFILIALFFLATGCSSKGDWRTRSRESAGIAIPAAQVNFPIVQVYVARAYSWRGTFAVHPWVAWKDIGDDQYTVAQVVGWRVRQGLPAVSVEQDLPDRHWFGNKPELIDELRGDAAKNAIIRIKELIKSYPHQNIYRVWPGPNSNTFIGYLIRHTPELKIELPPHAIGKDLLVDSYFLDKSPAGRGFQVSLLGILGLTLGLDEGIEVNILSLNFGIDFWRPALKLPFWGRLGFKDDTL